jgi:hypothetical protein
VARPFDVADSDTLLRAVAESLCGRNGMVASVGHRLSPNQAQSLPTRYGHGRAKLGSFARVMRMGFREAGDLLGVCWQGISTWHRKPPAARDMLLPKRFFPSSSCFFSFFLPSLI